VDYRDKNRRTGRTTNLLRLALDYQKRGHFVLFVVSNSASWNSTKRLLNEIYERGDAELCEVQRLLQNSLMTLERAQNARGRRGMLVVDHTLEEFPNDSIRRKIRWLDANYERAMPMAPEPPDWRPTDTIPEDYYAR
jgi:hypothetical protein